MGSSQRFVLILSAAIVLAACSSAPQVKRIKDVPDTADVPYENILVITLLESFDARRYLEKEVVKNLQSLGTKAVASTSMMNTKTPMSRRLFIEMAEKISADAILVTQMASLETKASVVTMRPETTVNFRPTYYYNVFSVEVTEYMEPRSVDFEYDLVLVSELFSMRDREPVWAIQASSNIKMGHETTRNYDIFLAEAAAITRHLSADGLVD
jgi:hypothetical protein